MPAKLEVVGSWPRFTRPFGFYAIARESIFLSYREKRWHQHFLLSHREDASDDARWSYFYVVSRWANNNSTFLIVSQASERASTWYRDRDEWASEHVVSQSRLANDFTLIRKRSDVFYALYCNKRRRRAYFYVVSFFRSIAREQAK